MSNKKMTTEGYRTYTGTYSDNGTDHCAIHATDSNVTLFKDLIDMKFGGPCPSWSITTAHDSIITMNPNKV